MLHRKIIQEQFDNNEKEFARKHDIHPSLIAIWDIHGPSKMAQLIMQENLKKAKYLERQKMLRKKDFH